MIAILVLFSFSSYLKMNEYPHKLPEEKYYYLSNSPNKNLLTTWLDIIYQRKAALIPPPHTANHLPPQLAHNMIMWKLFFLLLSHVLYSMHIFSFFLLYFLNQRPEPKAQQKNQKILKKRRHNMSPFFPRTHPTHPRIHSHLTKRFQVYFCSRHEISHHQHNQQTIHNK